MLKKLTNKHTLLTIFIACSFFYIIPLIVLNFFKIEDVNKAGFIIILICAFTSFAVNLIYIFLKEKYIYLPIIITVLSVPLIFIYNSSAVILIIVIALFSFFGYLVGSIIK